MRDDTIIPFPLNPKPSRDKPLKSCPFQAQAELRLAMLHKLVKGLARAQAQPELAGDVEEQCRYARELLREVSELYRTALAEVRRRASHA
ncbi:MAG: hypothetical protein ACN6O6_16685 [Pseudomonas sp.]|uniref:hypothetical protein n=1 Tax=Pseudomonas sp. TaxID=306 RepID=UPI003D144812